MSTISPMQLRRTMSYPSQPYDESQGVDPGQLFAMDPWSLSPAGPGKKLHLDHHAVVPETPMRKVRNHSIAIADTGLVTPQSVSRSFSTSALPFGHADMAELGHALPSPMMTPLTTPLATPLDSNDNPLELAFNKEGMSIPVGMNANFNFDLGFSGHTGPTLERGPSDIDMAQGINPFYRPPLCLRRTASPTADSDAAAAVAAAAAAAAGSTPIGSLSPLESEAGPLDTRDSISAADAAAAAEAAAAAAAAVGEPGPRAHVHAQALGPHQHYDLKELMPAGAYGDVGPLGDMQFRLDGHSPFLYPAAATQGAYDAIEKTRSRSSSASSVSSQSGDAEKPFVCESCSKGFRRMEHLRRHMKTHTLERPYVCTVPDCGRKFSRSDNLKAHILTHAKKTGRNVYVEGLVETHKVKPIKRRKSKVKTQIPA